MARLYVLWKQFVALHWRCIVNMDQTYDSHTHKHRQCLLAKSVELVRDLLCWRSLLSFHPSMAYSKKQDQAYWYYWSE
jgi:hypothetical protein